MGLITIYFYTMFNFVMNNVMAGNSKRFIGVILLVEFILFDCSRLFFIFLTGETPPTSNKLIITLCRDGDVELRASVPQSSTGGPSHEKLHQSLRGHRPRPRHDKPGGSDGHRPGEWWRGLVYNLMRRYKHHLDLTETRGRGRHPLSAHLNVQLNVKCDVRG